jgi:hypothetical protein
MSYSFSHLAVCLTTGPKLLPKRALNIVRSTVPSFRCEYPPPSLRSTSSFVRLLPRLPVTSIPPFIFPSLTCPRRQFLCNMWPIQLACCLLISCRIFLCSLTLSNTSSWAMFHIIYKTQWSIFFQFYFLLSKTQLLNIECCKFIILEVHDM